MTSITLPLKKFPGQTGRFPTFFGGIPLVAPMILLLTVPFTLYTYYHLIQESWLSYNLLGLLPYIWGGVSITGCAKKSRQSVDKLLKADLDEAEKIFGVTRDYFRKVLVSNIAFSIILMIVFSYSLIFHGALTLFIIGLSSVISIGITLALILSQSNVKITITYVCLVLASEASFLLITLRGLWAFDLLFLVASFLILFLRLHRIKGYDLRSFFERVVN